MERQKLKGVRGSAHSLWLQLVEGRGFPPFREDRANKGCPDGARGVRGSAEEARIAVMPFKECHEAQSCGKNPPYMRTTLGRSSEPV